MPTAAPPPTRREQRRRETVAEIKALALDQIGAGGPDAVSLNAIARSMAMSPAALYRYFDNRDALLADLVVELYDSLADALEAAAVDDGASRLRTVAAAYRRWALEHPHGYQLIFHTSRGSGRDLAPERTIPASTRSMAVVLAALLAAGTGATDTRSLPADLEHQLAAWAERSGAGAVPPTVLALGLATWTRLHGVISLELGGHLASVDVDPGLLFDAQVEAIAAEARGGS